MAKAIPQIIEIVKIDGCEMVIKLDEKIVVSRSEYEDFRKELLDLLDKYRL